MPEPIARYRYEALALAIAALAAVVHLSADGASSVREDPRFWVRGVQLLEGRATDLKFKIRGARPPHPDVVVAAVDERGAQKYGLWPWNRAVLAQAISRLVDLNARAIALDIEFTDAAADEGATFRALLAEVDAAGPVGDGPWAKVRAALAEKSGTSADALLAEALKKAGPRLVQGTIPYDEAAAQDFSAEKVAEQMSLLGPHLIRRVPLAVPGAFAELDVERIRGWSAVSVQTPLPAFATAGGRLAHFAAVLDADGTVRRVAPLIKLMGPRGLLPSLSMQAADVFLGGQGVRPVLEEGNLIGARLIDKTGRSIEVPFSNNEPFAPIFYPGPGAEVSTVSLRDIIEGTVDAAKIKDKLVFVGVTLVGSSGDQRVTPFSQIEPGVYTHAAFASNILSGQFLRRPAGLLFGELLALFVLCLALARLVPRFESFRVKALFIGGALLIYLGVDAALFGQGVQLATVLPLATILCNSFGLVFLGYASESQEKRAQRKTFERYLGADVLEEALKHPEKLDKGEKRELTVLFSDIRGFTTLSERMLPDNLAGFINDYLSPMTRIVFDEKGTLDKYIGDAVMAFWNAPLDQADHAMRACRAAIAMLKKLDLLKVKWRAEGYPEFDIGIGINTGQMIVGNMGSDVRVDYTVMGDAVNLASRLEGTNKEYETRVILGEGTWAHVKGQVTGRRLGAVRVKGKKKPVEIYELRGIGHPNDTDARAIAAFETALRAYAQMQWAEARRAFNEVLTLWAGDLPTRRYLEELEVLEQNPPGADWDGVYTATTK